MWMVVEGCLDQREGLTVMSLPLRNSDTTSMTCATSQPMPMHQSATGPDCAGVHAMDHHVYADGSQCGGTTAIAGMMPITSRDHHHADSVVESKMGTSKVADGGMAGQAGGGRWVHTPVSTSAVAVANPRWLAAKSWSLTGATTERVRDAVAG